MAKPIKFRITVMELKRLVVEIQAPTAEAAKRMYRHGELVSSQVIEEQVIDIQVLQ